MTRLASSSGTSPANAPDAENESVSAQFNREAVAETREHRQAFEQMVAVVAPADDMKCEVDLARRCDGERLVLPFEEHFHLCAARLWLTGL